MTPDAIPDGKTRMIFPIAKEAFGLGPHDRLAPDARISTIPGLLVRLEDGTEVGEVRRAYVEPGDDVRPAQIMVEVDVSKDVAPRVTAQVLGLGSLR